MASRFVSGGTADAPIERSDEWLAAQEEIEANRQKKAIEARQQDGKSLFEILEANKAAKQDAFEEANKIKNQFRSLDEDEVEFLDSVLESTRAEEERVKKETAEGLELFRKQQEEADKKARAAENAETQTQEGSSVPADAWGATGRKRKRTKENDVLKGVKVRRASSSTEQTPTSSRRPPIKSTEDESSPVARNIKAPMPTDANASKVQPAKVVAEPAAVKKSPPKKSLGLVDYVSDEDDD